ncbi:hypothetical protein IFM89_027636 [Coptis chinensis]|uniref:Uncharacterized protein n=1 Tax=Coptis chinensis TaxID=261450 RepID=A0A835IYS8_9MAGN|nr:hypothetical protein IFM89_027636 [Coptis chinensis]
MNFRLYQEAPPRKTKFHPSRKPEKYRNSGTKGFHFVAWICGFGIAFAVQIWCIGEEWPRCLWPCINSVQILVVAIVASIALGESSSTWEGNLLSAYGYGALEFEMGTYTYQSDVYSFGVMLELLTGRKSYDR